MKNLIKVFGLVLLLTPLAFYSCDDDDDDKEYTNTEIIGTWEDVKVVKSDGTQPTSIAKGTYTFKSDGMFEMTNVSDGKWVAISETDVKATYQVSGFEDEMIFKKDGEMYYYLVEESTAGKYSKHYVEKQ